MLSICIIIIIIIIIVIVIVPPGGARLEHGDALEGAPVHELVRGARYC